MHDLQLVGFTTDRRGLIFRTSAGARVESYVVPITDELVRLVGQLAEATPDDDPADIEVEDEPVVAVAEPRAESQLSVRDIQSRLRAGEDVARVAVEAGVDEDWIERFAPPVRAEQRRIVERALDCHLERSRGGPSSMPLRRAVGRAMADKGIAFTLAAFEAAWSARLVGHDRWTVEFTYYHRGRDRTVSWDFDAEAETLTTGDRTASQLGYVGADGEADDTTGLAVDGIIGDPEATTQIGAGSQAADARSTRNRTAKKQRAAKKKATKKKASPAKKKTTKKKASPAKKKATKKKASPAKKRAPKKRASPARKKATKKKASPAKKRVTKKAAPAKKRAPKKTRPAKKAGPAKKRVTKKAAPAKKRATAQQVIMEPTASPKVPPAEQVPGPSASGPAGAARSRATAPAETAPAPTSIESTPRPERPTTDADRTGTAPRLTRDELDRLVPAVPGPASTNGVKGREDAAPLSPEEELERLRARRVARQLAEDRTHAPAEDDRTAARRARAAERSAHTVQFRSGSAAPVRIAGATSGRPRPDAPETGNRRPTDAAADADTTGAPPPADANGAARPRSRRRRQLRAR